MANLPWLSDKLFCIRQIAHKSGWFRWFEWLCWYVLTFSVGFALPSFIYHYDLKKILKSREKE